MSQRIYFSGVGEPDPWNSRFLTGVSKQMLSFLTWDATPDLAQATWEWPSYVNYASCDGSYPSLKAPAEGLWHAIEREVKVADRDWERRGKKEFARQVYGS